jgi:aryl-alcohol dehydrogenase-like predicted oxidoreductase
MVPIIGFGVSGPLGLPLVTEASVSALVDAMAEAGAALFDTAPFYYAAQARLGRAIAGVSEAIVASKVGTVRTASGRIVKDYSANGPAVPGRCEPSSAATRPHRSAPTPRRAPGDCGGSIRATRV